MSSLGPTTLDDVRYVSTFNLFGKTTTSNDKRVMDPLINRVSPTSFYNNLTQVYNLKLIF